MEVVLRLSDPGERLRPKHGADEENDADSDHDADEDHGCREDDGRHRKIVPDVSDDSESRPTKKDDPEEQPASDERSSNHGEAIFTG